MHSITFLFYLTFLLPSFTSRLLNVIQINRHGARTSTNYNSGPLSKYFGSNMKLTPNGYRQHQLLGQFIRDKYINTLHFLNPTYKPSQFEIYSTQTQRTIFSAEGFISGLYPGLIIHHKYENKDLNIINNDHLPFHYQHSSNTLTSSQTIELNVIDLQSDIIFHPLSCSLYGKHIKTEMKKQTASPLFHITPTEITESIAEIAAFLNITLNPHTKQTINDNDKMTELQKLFFVYSYHFNKEWRQLSSKAGSLMRKLVLNKWYSTRMSDNSKYLKIGVSGLFDVIISKFERAKRRVGFLKEVNTIYTVYSAHDTTLVNILANVIEKERIKAEVVKAVKDDKVFEFLVPPFASNILFELHCDDNDTSTLYVRVVYNGKILKESIKGINDKDIKDNGNIPYDMFIKLLKSCIDYDYKNLDCSIEKGVKEDKESLFIVN